MDTTLTAQTTLIGQDEAMSILEKAISQSEADGVFVSLSNNESSLTRYSENQIGQNISKTKFQLKVTSYFGKRCATAGMTELDSEAIAATIRRSEELARIAPEDPEWVPLLEGQTYENRTPAFDELTATISPLARAEMVRGVCAAAAKAGVNGSGTLSTDATLGAIANSSGVRGCDRYTKADFGFTARIEDGSSWNQRTAWGIGQLPMEETAAETIDRAKATREPREVLPGVYPVIFSNAAFADLLIWAIWNLDARAADEGRSFMSRTDENGNPTGNRLGEQMFSPIVRVDRNPGHPLLQLGRFFPNGLSSDRLEVVKDGIPQALAYSRYWAAKQGKQSQGYMYPIVMEGSDESLAELVARTERAIFVNRAWYVRYVNPRTLEVTGMTRDGTFLIKDGKIAYPIKNLRFNQVLPEMLRDVDAVSKVERYGNSVVPGVRVKAFNFSSVTDSV
ncbi:MAG: TldD/PmbA family protein [Cyanobacteriota bacterium]|nr:TldD/PmbA family protein [Cyanobacteriota bacterium]